MMTVFPVVKPTLLSVNMSQTVGATLSLVMTDRTNTALKDRLKHYLFDLSRISFETENRDIVPGLKKLPRFKLETHIDDASDFVIVLCDRKAKPRVDDVTHAMRNLLVYLSREKHDDIRLINAQLPQKSQTPPLTMQIPEFCKK